MAIQDHSSLQTAVASWLARADLTASIPDFIQLAEVRLNRDLSTYQMLTTVEGAASGGLIELPEDFKSAVRLTVDFGGIEAEVEPLTSAKGLNDRLGSVQYGYVIEGTNIRLIGGEAAPDYTLTYYAKVRALSLGSNWLISAAPDLYLYASLLEATPFIQDDSRIAIWAGAYKAGLEALKTESDNARFSPSARSRLSMKTP